MDFAQYENSLKNGVKNRSTVYPDLDYSKNIFGYSTILLVCTVLNSKYLYIKPFRLVR